MVLIGGVLRVAVLGHRPPPLRMHLELIVPVIVLDFGFRRVVDLGFICEFIFSWEEKMEKFSN